jgi:hypothetical protein
VSGVKKQETDFEFWYKQWVFPVKKPKKYKNPQKLNEIGPK